MSAVHFQRNFRLLVIVLAIGALLMGIKFLAWILTNSNAILTDALESIINVVAGGFGLFSLYLASKPKDQNHPYGHGKIEFISAGFEGGLIFLAGSIIIVKAGYNLFFPQSLSRLDTGIFLVAFSGIVNYFMGHVLVRQGLRSNSLILRASGKHLKTDAYSSAGLIAGLGIIYLTGILWLDNLIAILFGILILYTGYKLVRTSVAGIMDEADYQLIEEIVQALSRERTHNWIDVHNFRVIKYGATLHIDCHLTLPYYFEVEKAHREIKAFERSVAAHCQAPVELFIHTDPCEPPNACRICRKADCAVREAPFEKAVRWSLDNLMKNKQHFPKPDKSQSTK